MASHSFFYFMAHVFHGFSSCVFPVALSWKIVSFGFGPSLAHSKTSRMLTRLSPREASGRWRDIYVVLKIVAQAS